MFDFGFVGDLAEAGQVFCGCGIFFVEVCYRGRVEIGSSRVDRRQKLASIVIRASLMLVY